MNKTKIEWTDYTSNPIRAERISDGKRGHYCTKVGDGCLHCYSEIWNNRFGTRLNYTAENADKVRFVLDEKELLKILRTKKTGIKIFVCDMTDIFHPDVPAEFVDRILAVAALRPDLIFQILTKRPGRMYEYLTSKVTIGWVKSKNSHRAEKRGIAVYRTSCTMAASLKVEHRWAGWPLPNVWLGTSISNQPDAEKNIAPVLQCPAAVRFVSIEPMLGPMDFCTRADNGPRHPWLYGALGAYNNSTGIVGPPTPRLDWVIVGGETGPDARPMHPDWARSVRNQCVAANVPFFFKQWGAWISTFPYIKTGDIHFRGDGQITGKVVEVDYEDKPRLTGPNLFGWVGKDVSYAEIKHTVEQDDRLGGEHTIRRVGKKAAGRILDRREWNEMPETEAKRT